MTRRNQRSTKGIVFMTIMAVATISSIFQYFDAKIYLKKLTESRSIILVNDTSDTQRNTPIESKSKETQLTLTTSHNNTQTNSKLPVSQPPPPFHVHPPGNRYSFQSPFLEGYRPTGGRLPLDAADYLQDPKQWRFVDNSTCLDSLPPQAWQYRAPYGILLGAMKAGTHAVIESLWEHPQVTTTSHWELHFYDAPHIDGGGGAIRTDRGIHRNVTLMNYAKAVQKAVGMNVSMMEQYFVKSESNPYPLMMIESSPKYLINSDRIPDFLLCVSPWVKLMAILRNPIARVESHYRFLNEGRRANNMSMVDWTTWIEDDLRLLEEAGVLNATTIATTTTTTTTTTRDDEYLAWKRYQRRPNSQQIVGRGLYIIPLEHYWKAMDRIGKPRSDLYVIQSERFLKHRQNEYNGLLEFLDLPPHQLADASVVIHKTENNAMPMPSSIRQKLERLYRPYNERLYKALGWDHVWN